MYQFMKVEAELNVCKFKIDFSISNAYIFGHSNVVQRPEYYQLQLFDFSGTSGRTVNG